MSHSFAFNTPASPARAARPAIACGLAGRWTGTLVRSGESAPVPFTLDGNGDAALLGQFPFATLDIPPADVTILEANDHSYVALVGPYRASGHDVLTLVEGVRNGGTVIGSFYDLPAAPGVTTRPSSGSVLLRRGRFEAKRVSSR